jgi:hypothetical protein
MNIYRSFFNLFTTLKININSSNSDRNLAIAIGEVTAGRSYDLTANPSGSFRALNLDPQVKILSGAPAITRPLYGANLKIELNGTGAANGNLATNKTGGVFAINCYSLITGSGHAVDKNVGMSALADCGSNLAGTTVTENTSLEVFGVTSRGSTVITNARSQTIYPPNHGANRRGLLIAAEGTTGLAVGANNISFENLGTSRFVGVATFVSNPIFVDGFVAQANSVCSSLLFTNGRRGALRSVSSNYNIASTDEAIVANATTGAITITMPNAPASVGGKFTIIKGDASGNTVTVTPINGSTRVLSSQYSFVSCVCDGTTWIAIS